jgi:hypothetical protein
MHATMHFLSQTTRYNLSYQCGHRGIKKSDNKTQAGKKVIGKGEEKPGDMQSNACPDQTDRQWGSKVVSQNRWSLRLLGLPPWDRAEGVTGLVLIQIDGLSMTQFPKALQSGRLPFLEKQIRNGRLGYKPMYSGMPSTTPAFQGELFYGVLSDERSEDTQL